MSQGGGGGALRESSGRTDEQCRPKTKAKALRNARLVWSKWPMHRSGEQAAMKCLSSTSFWSRLTSALQLPCGVNAPATIIGCFALLARNPERFSGSTNRREKPVFQEFTGDRQWRKDLPWMRHALHLHISCESAFRPIPF